MHACPPPAPAVRTAFPDAVHEVLASTDDKRSIHYLYPNEDNLLGCGGGGTHKLATTNLALVTCPQCRTAVTLPFAGTAPTDSNSGRVAGKGRVRRIKDERNELRAACQLAFVVLNRIDAGKPPGDVTATLDAVRNALQMCVR